jgi:hypothetical protein
MFRRHETLPVEVKKVIGDGPTPRVIQCGGGQTWVDPRLGASWVDLKRDR